VYTYVR